MSGRRETRRTRKALTELSRRSSAAWALGLGALATVTGVGQMYTSTAGRVVLNCLACLLLLAQFASVIKALGSTRLTARGRTMAVGLLVGQALVTGGLVTAAISGSNPFADPTPAKRNVADALPHRFVATATSSLITPSLPKPNASAPAPPPVLTLQVVLATEIDPDSTPSASTTTPTASVAAATPGPTRRATAPTLASRAPNSGETGGVVTGDDRGGPLAQGPQAPMVLGPTPATTPQQASSNAPNSAKTPGPTGGTAPGPIAASIGGGVPAPSSGASPPTPTQPAPPTTRH
jgi:hypothetical protein